MSLPTIVNRGDLCAPCKCLGFHKKLNKSTITIRKYTQIHKSGIAIDADSIIMKGASLRANCEQVNKSVALDLRVRETEVICYAMSRVIFINKQKVNK